MTARPALQQPMVTILGAALALGACKRGTGPGQAPAASGRTEQGAPRLELALKFDLGPMVQDETIQRAIVVNNRGSRPLEIDGVDRSRFCSGTVEPQIIAPGARGKLDVTCRSDLYGPLREPLDIRSNDPRAPKTTVELLANVTPLLSFDTTLVDFTMPFGEERSREVHLVGTRVGESRIRRKDQAVADVEVTPLSAEAGQAPGFRIHCKGRKVGKNVGNLILSTGLERPQEIALPYSCRVTGTLEVSPTNPYFNLKVSGPKVVNVVVRSTQPGFEVQAVQVAEGPFQANFERAGEGAFRVKVAAVEPRIDDETRSVTGKLVILSNDRTEPKKELELFGFGQVNRVERPAE
jgi:hypothetical protein